MSIIRIGDIACTNCELHKSRKQVVQNVINTDAEIAVLSNYPLKDNEELIKAFNLAGYSINNVSILNCCLCNETNVKIKKTHWQACKLYFLESLKLMPKLKIVIVFGTDAYKLTTNSSSGTMANIYMQPYYIQEYGNISFIPCYHPSSITYDESKRKLIYDGIKNSLAILEAKKRLHKTEFKSVIVENIDIFNKVFDFLKNRKQVCIDTEFTSLIIWKAELLSIHISFDINSAVAIPYRYYDEKEDCLKLYWDTDTNNKIKYLMQLYCTEPGYSVTGHNFKADSMIFRKEFGFKTTNLGFDTLHADFLIDSNGHHDLNSVVARWIPEKAGRKQDFWSGISKKDKDAGEWYKQKDLFEILEYGNSDAADEFELTQILARKIN